MTLTKPEQELLRRSLGDRVGRRERVQLGERGYRLLVCGVSEDDRSDAPVEVAVEVIVRDLPERIGQGREGDAGCKHVALEAVAGAMTRRETRPVGRQARLEMNVLSTLSLRNRRLRRALARRATGRERFSLVQRLSAYVLDIHRHPVEGYATHP